MKIIKYSIFVKVIFGMKSDGRVHRLVIEFTESTNKTGEIQNEIDYHRY